MSGPGTRERTRTGEKGNLVAIRSGSRVALCELQRAGAREPDPTTGRGTKFSPKFSPDSGVGDHFFLYGEGSALIRAVW